MGHQQTIVTLRQELQEKEHDLQVTQAELLEARSARERAERSAREAWAFAKTIAHVPRRRLGV